jgi:hypothetical protein
MKLQLIHIDNYLIVVDDSEIEKGIYVTTISSFLR